MADLLLPLDEEDARHLLVPCNNAGSSGLKGLSYLLVDGELVLHLVSHTGEAISLSRIPPGILSVLRSYYPWVEEHYTRSFEGTCMLFQLVSEAKALQTTAARLERAGEETRVLSERYRSIAIDGMWNLQTEIQEAVVQENSDLRELSFSTGRELGFYVNQEETRRARYACSGSMLLQLRRLVGTFLPTLGNLTEHPDVSVRMSIVTANNMQVAMQEIIDTLIDTFDIADAQVNCDDASQQAWAPSGTSSMPSSR